MAIGGVASSTTAPRVVNSYFTPQLFQQKRIVSFDVRVGSLTTANASVVPYLLFCDEQACIYTFACQFAASWCADAALFSCFRLAWLQATLALAGNFSFSVRLYLLQQDFSFRFLLSMGVRACG
jgi:hypothetical protein